MADTRRDRAAILALFADNATQDISAQDLRDYVVTNLGGYAEIRVDDGSAAQTGITTPTIMTGWASNGESNGLTADQANNKITIDVAGLYMIWFQNSFSGGANITFEFNVNVDSGGGYVEQQGGCHRKMSAGGDVGSAGFVRLLSLSAADDVAIFVEANSSASMTPIDAQFIIKQVA
jgi:hypothetical protein